MAEASIEMDVLIAFKDCDPFKVGTLEVPLRVSPEVRREGDVAYLDVSPPAVEDVIDAFRTVEVEDDGEA